LKILYISPEYYPRIDGVEYVVKSVSERLARMGHEVTVLAGELDIVYCKVGGAYALWKALPVQERLFLW